MITSAFRNVFTHLIAVKTSARRTLKEWVARPGHEPLVDVDRAVLTAIRPLPQWHVLLPLARAAQLRRIMLVNYIEFFPKAQTFIAKKLHEAVDVPVIIHHAVAIMAQGI